VGKEAGGASPYSVPAAAPQREETPTGQTFDIYRGGDQVAPTSSVVVRRLRVLVIPDGGAILHQP